ncbi:phospho-acceptor domain-containing protein [Chitinophaga niastensis]|uniref:histidine kinase n=1 Tax=Chitinophaga niastensis TaxID=536980 RepID=A0A2P8HQ60_CHINA|nr:ATP-binding protein [Chitinophaga niastensis]PSL48351.1 phospho-acceptor domain-containing protein [Chitinophaga niastensis]
MDTTDTQFAGKFGFLSGGGETGALIRSFNWTDSPIGSMDEWPQPLKTCIRIILTSRQPMFIWWGKELINIYNDAYKTVVGGKHPAALGQPAAMVWAEIWDEIGPRLDNAIHKSEGTYDEALLLIMHRNGYPEETYYTFSYCPIPDDKGDTAGILCANTDDTQRILLERELRTFKDITRFNTKSDTQTSVYTHTLQALAENKQDIPFAAFYALHKEGGLTGTTLDGLSEKVFPQFTHIYDAGLLWPVKEAISLNRPLLVEGLTAKFGVLPAGAWKQVPDNGLVIPVWQSGQPAPYGVLIAGLNPFRQLDEKYQSFFQLICDQFAAGISSVKALEEEQQRVNALLELDRAKTTFFSNISHEFRTPLSLILGPVEEILRNPEALSTDIKESLTLTHRNTLRLLKLVNSLLDFSRIEAGRIHASYAKTDIVGFTKELISHFDKAMRKGGLTMVVNYDFIDDEVYVDRDMWEKIVFNLISNAFKYTLKGAIAVRVTQRGDQVELTVADTGLGIAPSDLHKIFERFHRGMHTAGRSQEGSGIGLSLVHELVKLHEGTIHVTSTEGLGSTFTVSIPLGKDHLPADKIAPDNLPLEHKPYNAFVEEALMWGEEDHPDNFENHHPLRPYIILADDNADMREYIRRLLSDQYEVATVKDGDALLHMIAKRIPDLIISDVMMPGINGFSLVKLLKENPVTVNVPVMLLSARAGVEATIEGLLSGADDYLAKPFSARELLSRIAAGIKVSHSRTHAFNEIHHLFMQAPVAITILKGRDYVVELANELYLSIVDMQESELLGKSLLTVFPELIPQGFKDLLDQVFYSGQPYYGNEVPLEWLLKGEKIKRYYNFVYQPMRDMDESITGVIVMVTDISDTVRAKRKLEESESKYMQLVFKLEAMVEQRTKELQEANYYLEKSNKELEQFAYVTSHDLQEPLRKIHTFAGMLLNINKEVLNDASKLYIEKVMLSTRRMSQLIRDLLDFSRLAHVQEEFIPTDLNEILQQVLTDFEVTISQHNVQVSIDHLPKLPAIPLQMNQLFYNLLGNALKFITPSRTPVIHISASMMREADMLEFPVLDADKDYYEIVVSDNGIGFDQIYADKIFQIFQRLNDRATFEGTGIGLALCNKIVLNHRGHIYAKGKPGEGASFVVILPALGKIVTMQ